MASQFLFIFTFEFVNICKTNQCSLIKYNELSAIGGKGLTGT